MRNFFNNLLSEMPCMQGVVGTEVAKRLNESTIAKKTKCSHILFIPVSFKVVDTTCSIYRQK